jgi:hypothetical protein
VVCPARCPGCHSSLYVLRMSPRKKRLGVTPDAQPDRDGHMTFKVSSHDVVCVCACV